MKFIHTKIHRIQMFGKIQINVYYTDLQRPFIRQSNEERKIWVSTSF